MNNKVALSGELVTLIDSGHCRKMDGTAFQVLHNVSFTISDGKKLGLSGRTGR